MSALKFLDSVSGHWLRNLKVHSGQMLNLLANNVLFKKILLCKPVQCSSAYCKVISFCFKSIFFHLIQ